LAVLCLGALTLAVANTARSSASEPPPPDPSPIVAAPAKKALSVIERARAGEPLAVAALEALPAERRTAEESHAIARGRVALQHQELARLLETVRADPTLLDKPQTIAGLRTYLDNSSTAIDALRGIAELPSSRAPDLLYETLSKRKKPDDTSRFAEELLYGETVRHTASPALRAVLELKRLKGCDRAEEVVSAAREHGDRRALAPLVQLTKRRGCGPKGRRDCYPCLRNRAGVVAAVRSAKKRAPPTF
jgi:hypothetical protein